MTHPETSHFLEEGLERCTFCHQSYSYELELICVECDSPVCPLCVVRRRGHSCPVCIEPADDAEEH